MFKSYGKNKELSSSDIQDSPSNTISCIASNTDSTQVLVGSWDKTLSLYSIPRYSYAGFKLENRLNCPFPVLSCCFFKNMLCCGLIDGSICLFTPEQNVFPAHSAAVKSLVNYKDLYVISGSFDQNIKVFDMNSPNPIYNINLGHKVFAMDLKGDLLVVACSDLVVKTYNIAQNFKEVSSIVSKTKYSLRSVSSCNDQDSYCVGTIDGIVDFCHVTNPTRRYQSRCHRQDNKVYSVNCTRFSPLNTKIVATGGSDGILQFYDKVSRMRLINKKYEEPVTALEFTNDGKYVLFGTGDDFSMGPGQNKKTMLRYVKVDTIPELNK